MTTKKNLNNRYFNSAGEYIYVIESELKDVGIYSVYGVSVLSELITIGNTAGPIILDEDEEISEEEFIKRYNEVLTMIEQNLPFKKLMIMNYEESSKEGP